MLLIPWKVAATAVLMLGTGVAVLAFQASGDAKDRPSGKEGPPDAPAKVAPAPSVQAPRPPGELEAQTRAIEEVLDKAIVLNIPNETTLADFLKAIRVVSIAHIENGVPVYVDPKGLQEAKLRMDSQIHVVLIDEATLRENVRHVLRPLGLDFRVRDGLFLVSSRDRTIDEEIEGLKADLKNLTEKLKAAEARHGPISGGKSSPPNP